jgi:tetratricopeptide (TPR) repeat protein
LKSHGGKTMRGCRVVLLPWVLLALGGATASAAPAPWWNDAWGARHRLTVPIGLPAEVDAVQVDMTTFGRLRGDAGDLRVVTRAGKLCPHRLLAVGPGDRVRFLFRPVPGERVYLAYFGHPRADPPAEVLQHRAGLVLEVRDLPAGPFQWGWQVVSLLDRAATVRGRLLRPKVFDGANVVGPSARFIARYRGHFEVAEGGTYRFCTASSDASVVRIDGTVVTAWGGAHHAHAGRRGRFGGPIQLAAGVHELEYYWVNASAHPAMAVLGWQRPRDRTPWLMPATAFLQPWPAHVGPIELLRGEAPADFTWRPLHHVEREGQYAVALLFRQATGLSAGDRQYRWSFGDGTVARGRAVRKVFFGTGPRRVRLQVTDRGTVRDGTLTVDVRPLWTQIRPPRGKGLAEYRQAFAHLDADAAAPRELAAAIMLADDLGRTERLAPLWDALVQRPRARSEPFFAGIAAFAGARFQMPPFSSTRRAEAALWLGIGAAGGDAAFVRLTLRLTDLLVNARGKPDAATAALEALAGLPLAPRERRGATILRGDIAAERGAFDRAAQLYEEAGATVRAWDRQAEIRRAAVLFSAEDYLRRKEYVEAVRILDEWLFVQPGERLRTRCLLALGRAHCGGGARDRGVVLFERALRLEPSGPDAPRLLLDLADARRAAGEKEKAAEHERVLRESFPYSEEAARLTARKKGIKTGAGT